MTLRVDRIVIRPNRKDDIFKAAFLCMMHRPGHPVGIIFGGKRMRKGALLLAILMAASAPTSAFAAKKKTMAKPAPVAADPNASGKRFVTDAVGQIFVPWQSMTQPKK
jgi:hypothetical protein